MQNFPVHILETYAEMVVKRTLETLGVIPKYISRTEMVKRIGRGNYDRGVQDGFLNIIKKGGPTSPIFCLRQEFEKYEQMINP